MQNINEENNFRNSVGLIIVNYNDSIRTLNLVKNVINFPTIKNVIIVNNNSSDDSLEHLQLYSNDKYVICNSTKNGGYGYGNNIGIKKANELSCEFVLICNPDIIFSEATLLSMLNTISSDDKCAIVNAKETYLGNFAWKYTNGFNDVMTASILYNKLFSKRYYEKSYFEHKEVAKVDIIQGSFLLVPTKLMINFGMYDEDFFLYEEEKILYKKFIDKGFHSLTDLKVNYEHHHIDSKHNTLNSYLKSKKNLLDSKYKFVERYRRFNSIELFLTRCFFKLTMVEMYLYGLFLVKIKKRKNNERE
ncbi:glycosyltransferase [Streptococcus pneumoniae]|nr:glycosyltransferase [Streptococcus pneumoniae]